MEKWNSPAMSTARKWCIIIGMLVGLFTAGITATHWNMFVEEGDNGTPLYLCMLIGIATGLIAWAICTAIVPSARKTNRWLDHVFAQINRW